MVRRLLAFGLLGLLVAGCSETFEPFVPDSEGFAFYGFLDARRDTQFVRVEPLADREVDPQRGDAQLTTTDQETGETLVWRDSLVALDDGTQGLLFFYPFTAQPNRSYDIAVSNPNGDAVASRAVVPMPVKPIVAVTSPQDFGNLVSQRLLIGSEIQPTGISVLYVVRRVDTGEEIVLPFDYEARPAAETQGFEALVNLSRNAETIRLLLGLRGETVDLELLRLQIRFDIVDSDRVIVGNGLGVMGVAAEFESIWVLGTEFVERLGFLDAQYEGWRGQA